MSIQAILPSPPPRDYCEILSTRTFVHYKIYFRVLPLSIAFFRQNNSKNHRYKSLFFTISILDKNFIDDCFTKKTSPPGR